MRPNSHPKRHRAESHPARLTNRRSIAALGIALASALAVMMSTAGAASADLGARYQSVTFRQPYLTAVGPRSEAVTMGPSRGADTEVWYSHLWRDGTARMRVLVDGAYRCLDDSPIGLRAFSPCWPGSSGYSRYQSWYRIDRGRDRDGNRLYSFRNQATRNCLDWSPIGLRMFPCNGTPYQTWRELLI